MQALTADKLYKAFVKMSQSERTKFYNQVKTEITLIDSDIVAYSVTGEPLNRVEYETRINDAIEECNRGEYVNNDDYIKARASWK